jgi:uncharacterized RDD family membrane protein YckC
MENNQKIKYAGFFTRLLATIIDIILIIFMMKLIENVIPLSSYAIFVLWGIYTAVMINKWHATLGGMLCGIKVLSSKNLEALKIKMALIRFFISIVPFQLYGYLRGMQHMMDIPPSPTASQLPQLIFMLAPLVMFFTEKKQMIHDMIAKSIVIDTNNVGMENQHSTGTVRIGRNILRTVGTLAFLVVFGYMVVYVSIFYTIAKGQQKSYDASFSTHYQTNDYNNSKIIFYQKELEKYSKEFVEAKEMYDIFGADTKKDLALGCISYFLRKEGCDSWIDMGSKFRKNTRNKYAETKEKIKQAKRNENFMGKHFYTFDLNMVNHGVDKITKLWSDKNDSICENTVSVDELYDIFINKYIVEFENQNIHSPYGSKPQQRELDWFEILKYKHPDIFQKREEEKKKYQLELEEIQKKAKERKRKAREKERIENIARYNSDLKRGLPPIFAAIQNKLHDKLTEAIATGEDLNEHYKNRTPLFYAIYNKDIKAVEALLKAGANPNVIDEHGLYTPLSISNNLEYAKMLIKYGADVNFQHNKSETALMVAAKGCSNFVLVRFLLEQGANPKLQDRYGYNIFTGLKKYCHDKKKYKKMIKLIKDWS